MLATIREYACEQLDVSGETERIRRAHALYYLGLAETAEPRNQGPRHALSLLSLEAEHANLRMALGWTLEQPERAVLGARLAAALGWFWTMRAHFSEGGRWLDRMRATLAEQGHRSGPVHAKLLLEAGWMALYRDDFEQARSLLRQSLAHYRELGDIYLARVCSRHYWS
jgi:predicted ATPase